VFESPTIAGLAKDIEAAQSTTQKITNLSIPASSRKGDLSLSFAQTQLWFLDQLEPNRSVYNLANAIRLKGALNIRALERSLNEIVRRHEALRTRFPIVEGQPIQVISLSFTLPLPLLDFSHLSESDREAEAQRLADEENQQGFDLARGPLLRSKLVRLSDDDHVLLVNMHHMVSDGWSMGIFFRELSILYQAFSKEKPSPLSDLPIQYADYTVWQHHLLEGEELDRLLAYWKGQLAGAPAVLHLPADRPRPSIQTFRGAKQPVAIPKSVAEALKALSHREGVTLFMTLLAAFKVLLSRYTGETDIVVGAPVAGRTHRDSEELIGFFANTLVLRTDASGDPTFRALLKRVKKIALEAYAHQELPFERLVEFLQPERALSYNPLFQILFALNNTRNPVLELPGLAPSHMELDRGTARFDLALDLCETPAGLVGVLEYNTDLFDATTITRMAGHFATLLESIGRDPNQRVSTLPLLTAAERRKCLVEWNGTPITQAHDLCIHEMFEAQVKRVPESVAVVCEGNRLTYRELNRRANRLAHFLTKLGVEPEVPVGICVERSVDMLVGLLAILKAGGAYVPLDPAYPVARLAFMLDDVQAPVLLTQQHILEKLPRQQNKVICLDTDWEKIAKESEEDLSIGVTPDNLAYVIYTSGSTGLPKGVQICHRNVCRLLEAVRPSFGFDEHDVWTVFHSYAFDFSVWEIWGALLQSARLVVVPLQIAQSPAAFHDLLRSEGVTVLNQTPSAMRQLLEASLKGPKNAGNWNLRLMICGGEAFAPDLASASMEWGVPVWNFYGPTEATVWAAITPITATESSGESIPIGRPIAGKQIYLLDENLQPVPVGIPGELHIGGGGLARGYFKRPELTAERFIPDPFSNDPGARLYRTGDRARYLPNGAIEFLGRIDHQIKIRGFRVEPGEVESVLRQHPSVRETVVTAFEESSHEKTLVAYVVSKQASSPTDHELRSFLKKKLPDYMAPSVLVFLDSLPLTSNGKVNRNALPAPDRNRAVLWRSYAAARTPIEEKLADIWGEVLGLERVGIHDNFFALGGHSLKATRVISQLRQVFQIELPLRSLFEHPTVAGLAESLEAVCSASNRSRQFNVNPTTARETGKI
jgi:amino acid adenylation domain-containing protein